MQRNMREIEERDRELAEKVASASLEQIKLKFDADMAVLKQHVPSKEKESQEAALDIKYLQKRQKMLVPVLKIRRCQKFISFPFFEKCGTHTHTHTHSLVRAHFHA